MNELKYKMKMLLHELADNQIPELIARRSIFTVHEKYEYNLDKFVDLMSAGTFSIINSARQIGLSSMLIAYGLSQSNKKVIYIVNNINQIKEFVNIVKKMGFPPKKAHEIANIHFIVASSDAFCSESPDIVIFDNAAFYDGPKGYHMLSSVIPTLSTGKDKKLIIASVPNGHDAFFHESWKLTKEGKSSFTTCTLRHIFTPEKLEELRLNLGSNGAYAEQYLNEFVESEWKIKGKTISLRLDEKLHEQLKTQLENLTFMRNSEIKISDYIRELIIKDLKQNKL